MFSEMNCDFTVNLPTGMPEIPPDPYDDWNYIDLEEA